MIDIFEHRVEYAQRQGDRRHETPMNLGANPLGLYDMPSPDAPYHLAVRRAVELHREGERAPVWLGAERQHNER